MEKLLEGDQIPDMDNIKGKAVCVHLEKKEKLEGEGGGDGERFHIQLLKAL